MSASAGTASQTEGKVSFAKMGLCKLLISLPKFKMQISYSTQGLPLNGANYKLIGNVILLHLCHF